MRACWMLVFVAGCANQFEADYDPSGTFSYAEMRGTPEGCAEGFAVRGAHDVGISIRAM